MICKIAELTVEVPEVGDLVSRCQEYICRGESSADIVIRTGLLYSKDWKILDENARIYMESGIQFLFQLLQFDGLMLHASAVELDGKAYLFSGNSGMGKSTHTRIWQSVFGEDARVFNDDKPALRFIDGTWYAYGTPWCGKDSININMKVPVAGICFLKQASENRIRRLSHQEAVQNVISQTLRRFKQTKNLDLMLSHVDNLVRRVPIFEMENRPEPEAAFLSYETMRRMAEEVGL